MCSALNTEPVTRSAAPPLQTIRVRLPDEEVATDRVPSLSRQLLEAVEALGDTPAGSVLGARNAAA